MSLTKRKGHRMLKSGDFVPPHPLCYCPYGRGRKMLQIVSIFKFDWVTFKNISVGVRCRFFHRNDIRDSHKVCDLGFMENSSIPPSLTKMKALACLTELWHGGHPVNYFYKSTRPGTHKGTHFYRLCLCFALEARQLQNKLCCDYWTFKLHISARKLTQKSLKF